MVFLVEQRFEFNDLVDIIICFTEMNKKLALTLN